MLQVKPGIPKEELPVIVDACRRAVSLEHGLSLTCVCIIETRSIEKTTSGKIARAWCRRAFVAGKLKLLLRWDGDPTSGESEAVSGADADQADARGSENAVAGEGEALVASSGGSGLARFSAEVGTL